MNVQTRSGTQQKGKRNHSCEESLDSITLTRFRFDDDWLFCCCRPLVLPTKLTEQLWKLNDDSWAEGNDEEDSWMGFWFGKKLKHGCWTWGLSGNMIWFEDNLLRLGSFSVWLSIANDIAFCCSSTPLSYASSPASVLRPVIVIISDLGVFFFVLMF